ncbi:MAG TPA: PAS domain S-box protein, partial [Candidatus Wallbacteria bacterium]|nr:PAS domain S-box protein [Candidatus Wallbacteria bacterium]
INLGPGIDGTKAAAIILKKHELPLVFLSSHTDPKVVEKTEKITSYGYIVKNSGETVLIASVKMAFRLFEANVKEKEKTRALRESEEKYRTIFNNSVEGIFQTTPEGRYRTINPSFAGMYGYDSPEEMINAVINIGEQLYVHPEERNRLIALMSKSEGMVKNFEARQIRKDGSLFWISINACIIRDNEGNPSFFEGTCMDVTERKRIEEALRESENKYRTLIECSNDVIFSNDKDGKYQYVNNVFASTFNQTPEYFIGKSFWDAYSKEQADIRYEAITRIFQTGEPGSVEVDVPLPDKTLHFLATLNPVKDSQGNVISVLTHSRDITDRKRMEDALKESEEKFKEVFENSLDNIFVVDVFPGYRFKIKTLNGALEKCGGHNRKDIEGKFIDEVFPENIAGILSEKYKYCVESRKTYCFEELAELLDEKPCYSTNLVPVFNKDGEVFRIIGISRDISDSKKAELARQESESKYRLLVDYSSDLIWSMNAEGLITYASPSWKRVTGYAPESLVGKQFRPLVHPDDIHICVDYLHDIIKSKNIMRGPQYRVRHADGSWHWHCANVAPVLDQDGGCISLIGVTRDITERIQSEEKIRNLLNEKELILKEVHHRIKNNMNTIFGLLTIQAQAPENSSAKNILQDAAGRVKSMMVLYDKLYCSQDNRTISLKEYIPALVDEIAGIFSKSASLEIQTQVDDIVLNASILSPLGIIINEFISNAVKYAFIGRSGGLITVKASKKGSLVSIKLKDNGPGIPESVLYENSSGFGLLLVEMLAKQLNGSLTIERQNGTGYVIEFEA